MKDESDPDCPPARPEGHEHEWELFQLLEQVPVGIFVVTAAGKPYYANRQARRLLRIGGVPEHVRGFCEMYRAYEIGTDRLYPVERLPLVRALAGERCEISDIELRRDGAPVQLHISGAPMHLRGALAFSVSALQDVGELRRIATTDALTGLPNRTAFHDAFARALAGRAGSRVALALIDFDRFKSINDEHGHAKGDEVLCSGSAAIVGALRSDDVVARWGGEELVVLLPNTDLEGARRAIDGAIAAVRGLAVASGDGTSTLRVTCSAGVVEATGGESLAQLVARADILLYAAKHAGRDRVLAGA